MRRGYKIDVRAIILLLFGLVTVLVIWHQMRKTAPQLPAELARLEDARVGIVDSSYINLPLKFVQRMPNGHWQLAMLTTDSLFAEFQSDCAIEDQIIWLMVAIRPMAADTAAQTNIGLLQFASTFDATDMAINYLSEIIAKYEQGGGRLRILQQVCSPAHPILTGAYFAVVLPNTSAIEKPVWIITLLPRGKRLFIIKSETTESAYPFLRDELMILVRRFFPLPSTVH